MDPESEYKGLYEPGAFKLDHLESKTPIFEKWFPTLLYVDIPHAAIPFQCMQENGNPT